MKTYARIARRRLEAALRITNRRRVDLLRAGIRRLHFIEPGTKTDRSLTTSRRTVPHPSARRCNLRKMLKQRH